MSEIFTIEERKKLRAALLKRAAEDPRLSGIAITGSAALGRENRWSDIDLAFGVAADVEVPSVLDSWSMHMYETCGAIDHLDLTAGTWVYRVFFLANTLQVDLGFVPEADFRGVGPTFRLVGGKAQSPSDLLPPRAKTLIAYGWLYALHARSCIARDKLWQAEYMISAMRDQTLALACLRHGLSAVHGRGFDQLPYEIRSIFDSCIVKAIETHALRSAFAATTECFLKELKSADQDLFERLCEPMQNLIR